MQADNDPPLAVQPEWELPDPLSILDQSTVAFSILDLDGRQRYANPAFWRLFGHDDSSRSGEETAASLTHPDDRSGLGDYLPSLYAGSVDDFSIEKKYLRADGSVFRGRLRAGPIRDAHGNIQCILGAITDVSDDLSDDGDRLEADMERRRHQDGAIDGATTIFVASISHELRAPLHAILGLAELLSDAPLGHDEHRHAEAIHHQAVALRHVVDDLLDYSKIEAGRLTIRAQSFSPRQLLSEVAVVVRHEAEQKGLLLVLEVDPSTPAAVEADSLRLRQIMVNLASNAVRHTESGFVRLAVSSPAEGELSFAVIDSGVGIEASLLPRIFEVFTQAGDGRIGTGLGLAISRQLADLLGGSLSVTSEVGVGSTFLLRLPISAASPKRRKADLEAVQPNRQRGHILVAEDGAVNQHLVKSQLAKLGYACTIAENGRIAAQAVATGSFDAVLMDWHMPEVDGLESTRLIRSSENGRTRVPIIAVTASAMIGNREECIEAGMDDFVSKPLSLEELSTTLERWVGPRAAARAGTNVADAAGHRRRRTDEVPATTVVDQRHLERWIDDLADTEVVAAVIRAFLDELDAQVRVIETVSLATDPDAALQVMRAARTLRSSSEIIGATSIGESCRNLENLIRSSTDTGAAASVEAVSLGVEIVRLAGLATSELTGVLEGLPSASPSKPREACE